MKQALLKTIKSENKRLLVIVGIVLVVVAAFYIGNAIARGSSKGEQRILGALFSTLSKQNVNAKITTSSSGGSSVLNVNGNISLADADKISANLALSMQQNDKQISTSFDVRGTVSGKTDLFIKTEGLGTLVNVLLSGAPEAKVYADQAVSKINGKWMVVSKNGGDKGAMFNCSSEIIGKIKSDESHQKQVIDSYKKNRFIFVKSTTKENDNTTYSVKINTKILDKFMESLQQSSLVKDSSSCNDVNLASVFDSSDSSTSNQQTNSVSNSQEMNVSLNFTIGDDNELKSVAFATNSNNGQATHVTAALSYDKVKPADMPTENLVPATSILPEISQMTGVIQQAASQQQQQQNALQQQIQ